MTRREKNYHWRKRMIRSGILYNLTPFIDNINVAWIKFRKMIAQHPSGTEINFDSLSAYPLKEAYPDNDPDDLKDINI